MMTMTKMMTTTRNSSVAAFCALALVLAGCDRGELPLTETEARERTSSAYAAAMEDLQAGRIDHAIEGFQKVIRAEPRSLSAHFQLATLLQDAKQDYIGAIAHFREYRALRPGADKASLAKDREELCLRLLAAQLQKTATPGEVEAALKAENEKLSAELKKLKAENIELSAALTDSKKNAKTLGEQVASLRKMVEGIGASAEADDDKRPKSIINPSDAALLDDEDDSRPIDRIAMSEDLKSLKLEDEGGTKAPFKADSGLGAGEESGKSPFASTGKKVDKDSGQRSFDSLFAGAGQKKDKDKNSDNSRPASYTVQQGDTLFRISERFYGSSSHWRKIREANKATVPPDGRVNAGQVILLP